MLEGDNKKRMQDRYDYFVVRFGEGLNAIYENFKKNLERFKLAELKTQHESTDEASAGGCGPAAGGGGAGGSSEPDDYDSDELDRVGTGLCQETQFFKKFKSVAVVVEGAESVHYRAAKK